MKALQLTTVLTILQGEENRTERTPQRDHYLNINSKVETPPDMLAIDLLL